jgi:LmbE family N-acetylglucosaminyl deacetylase
MDQKCLLAVFAHPDDEAFGVAGVMRKYRDEGVKTALVCATRGEAGEISDPALATPETLGQVREGELRAAARIMGIEDVSFLDYRDGDLSKAGPDEAIGRIVYHIRRLRPQVVVTFDANGGYGHLDHMAIHRLTIEAFHRAGDPSCYPEQLRDGLQPYAPRKLYVTANPLSAMRKMREQLQAQGIDFMPGGNAATIPIGQMGTPDEEITTVVPLDDRQFDAKMDGMRAHRTQQSPNAPFDRMPREQLRAWLGTERFVLIDPKGAPPHSEHDLFQGVASGE